MRRNASWLSTGGSLAIFFERPASGAVAVIALVLLILPFGRLAGLRFVEKPAA